MICSKCQVNVVGSETCPLCNAETTEATSTSGGRKIDRTAFWERQATCRQCIYWTRRGCGMLERPCRVERLWLSPEKNWCVMGLET